MRTWIGSLTLVVILLPACGETTRAEEPAAPPRWAGTLQRPDGQPLSGRIVAESPSGLSFSTENKQGSTPLPPGAVVTFESPRPGPAETTLPFRAELGLGRRISGRLGRVDQSEVRLDDSSAAGAVVNVVRGGVSSIVQRRGEIQILDDGFESLPGKQWTLIGDPELADDPKLTGDHSLRIPAGGCSVTRQIAQPVPAGRLELAFHDQGLVEAHQQAWVDLQFRGPTGPETVRVVLGWAESSLSVESPGGPALAVQRLARQVGWHRLSIRFGPDQTEIAVDGNDLAHGKGTGGPLVELRLASQQSGAGQEQGRAADKLAVAFDDLRLVQFAESGTSLEIDATQDEVRLTGGNQVFGSLIQADAERIKFRVEPRDLTFSWSEVSGLYFKRVARQAESIDGIWLRVDWRSAPGHDSLDLDRVDGSLVGLDDRGLTLQVPYVGRLTVPRDRLARLEVLGAGRRIVVDATPHHLGNDLVGNPLPLDPPQPEGRTLERSFELTEIPKAPASLSLDVVQVAGEASGLPFSNEVKSGEIRTNISINNRPVDYLNRYVSTMNETPERVRIPIPAGLLRPGPNQLRIEQAGKPADPNEVDDIGILEIALDFIDPPGQSTAPVTPEKP